MATIKKADPVATSDSGFRQEPPTLKNQYEDDVALKNLLKKILPGKVLSEIEPDLVRMGDRVVNDIAKMGENVETPSNYPQVKQYDAWCKRVDEITVSKGWEQLNDVACEEGLVAIAYERKYNEFSRVYQFAKQFIYAPSSAMYSCPLSMTDGAARVIELAGTEEMKQKYYPRLISRDPKEFWTSGQWMTERPGGSDVSNMETIAELIDENTNTWSVSGFKWFSSATTADMTMLLARSVDPKDGTVKTTTRGLSLYLAEMKLPNGEFNGVRVHRLKDKFGTKGLPTAELELSGMKATLVGQIGRGVPNIASILNITRIYCCFGVVSSLRRCIAIAKDFSQKRLVFNASLDTFPLHVTTLAQLELFYRAGLQISFFCTQLLGRTECIKDNKEDMAILRFITPIAKAYVCKFGMKAIMESMEALGGQGYMEDVGIATQVRNAQVNTIWEGTTNVLSVDVLRVIRETKGQCMATFEKVINEKIAFATKSTDLLNAAAKSTQVAMGNVGQFFKEMMQNKVETEANARQLTFALGRTLAGALLIEQAAFDVVNNLEGAEGNVIAAKHWCRSREFNEPLILTDANTVSEEAKLVFGSAAKI